MREFNTEILRQNIGYYKVKHNLTDTEIAKGMGITQGAWSIKQKNLENLKIKDLNNLLKVIRCPSLEALLTPLR